MLLPFDLFFIAILTFIIFIVFFIFVYFVLFLCDFNPHDFFIYNAFGLITRIMIQKVNTILLFLSYFVIFLSMKLFYSYLIFILLTNKIIDMFLEYYEDMFPYFWQAIIFCIELLFSFQFYHSSFHLLGIEIHIFFHFFYLCNYLILI